MKEANEQTFKYWNLDPKRKLLTNQTGGFLPLVPPAVLSLVGGLVGKAIGKRILKKMALVPKELVSEYYQPNKPEIRVEDNISNLLHEEEKSDDGKAKLLSHWIPKYQRLKQPPPPPKPFEIPKELL
ncbi:uncharacterized protein TNCV_3866391 [Trichonephila clavipes]|nr:uncharacterized protein TNCV_3866391 [Trichonephila clavipes]